MKKALCSILTAAIMLTVTACGGSENSGKVSGTSADNAKTNSITNEQTDNKAETNSIGIPAELFGVYDDGNYFVEITSDGVSFFNPETAMVDEIHGSYDGNKFVDTSDDFSFTVSDDVLSLTFKGTTSELPKISGSADNNINDDFVKAKAVKYEVYRYSDVPDDVDDHILITYYDNGSMQIQMGTRMHYAGYANTSDMGKKTPVSGYGGDKWETGYEYYIALSVDGSTGYITRYEDDTTYTSNLEIVN